MKSTYKYVIILFLLLLPKSMVWGVTERKTILSRSWVEPSCQTATVLLRKEFGLMSRDKISHATLYVASLGMHEAWINGKRVGDEYFAPGWTEYNQRLQYKQYDVTTWLSSNRKNTLGIVLANGWIIALESRAVL